MNNQITSRSITLRTKQGHWLGQIVLTSDGMFASVTDYGNFSFAWRSFGGNFEDFLLELNPEYFGSKLFIGMSYIVYNRKVEQACNQFAEIILPALQEFLKEERAEIKQNIGKCDCEDHENGMVSNCCPVHNYNPYPKSILDE